MAAFNKTRRGFFGEEEEPLMPFGRFKGVPLSEISRTYLGYVLGMPNLHPALADAVRDELRQRGLGFGKYKDKPLSKVPPWYLRWLLDGDILLPPWGDLVKEELKRRMAA